MNGMPPSASAPDGRLLIGATALLGLLFASVQPDGAPPAEQWLLYLQWQLQTVGPMALLVLARHALAHGLRRPPSSWAVLLTSGVLVVVSFTPLALALDVAVGAEAMPASWPAALADELLGFAPPALACWLALNVVLRRRETVPATPRPAPFRPASPPESGLMEKLPAAVRGLPILIKAELQYLDVTTERGSALVLYSLRDAVKELGNELGLQPHRSYWVRRDQIRRLHRDGRQGRLELVDGRSIPVSRQRLADVRQRLDEFAIARADGEAGAGY